MRFNDIKIADMNIRKYQSQAKVKYSEIAVSLVDPDMDFS